MTRLQKRLCSGYEIGNDHAIEVYEKIMKKLPGFELLHFAVVEDLWRTYSRSYLVDWLPTTDVNLEIFHMWTMDEVV